jgi:hypothetical protein
MNLNLLYKMRFLEKGVIFDGKTKKPLGSIYSFKKPFE